MNKPTMAIVEAQPDIRFRNLAGRDAHALKHVLGSRGERWHSVLPAELIESVRDEIAAGIQAGAAFRELAHAYERCLAEKLHDFGQTGRSHVHVLKCDLDEELNPSTIRAQDILAWDTEDAIWLVAGFPVRKNSVVRFGFLRTGYRPFKRMPKRAFARRMRERVRERTRMRDRVILAWHDGTVSEGGES